MSSSKTSRCLDKPEPGDGARMVATLAPLATLPFLLAAAALPPDVLLLPALVGTLLAVVSGLLGTPFEASWAAFFAGEALGDASGASARLIPGGEMREAGGFVSARVLREGEACDKGVGGEGEWDRAKGIAPGEPSRAKGEGAGE